VSQRKSGALLGYVNIIVKNMVYLVYTPMLLHFVGQADYGVYQTANSFVFSLTLLTFGFSQAYVRFYMRFKAKGDKKGIESLNGTYLIMYAAVSIIALILGLVFASCANIFFSKGFTPDEIRLARILLSIMAVNIAVTLFSTVFDAYIISHEEFVFQQSRQLFTTLATPLIAFALLELGAGTIGVACAQLAVTVILLLLNMKYSIKKLGMQFYIRGCSKSLLMSIAIFSAWIFTNQICDLINDNMPNVLLGMLSGAEAVAVFAVAVQIRAVFSSLSVAMASIFTPLINQIVAERNDNRELTMLMTRIGRYQAILFLWIWGGFILVGRFFVAKWAGTEFDSVYWMVIAMTTAIFIPLVQNTGIEIQRAKNMHKARSIVYLCMAVVNLAITILLAPYVNVWAPTLGYMVYSVVGCGIFMNWYYQNRIGLDMLYFWRKMSRCIIAALPSIAVCVIASHWLSVVSWFSFVIWGFVYTAIYTIVAYRFMLNKDEKEQLKSRVLKVGK